MGQLLSKILIGLAGPVAFKIFAALGITIGSYYGMSYTVDNLIAYIQSSYNNIATSTLTILNLAGFGDALGIMLGAYVSRATLQAAKIFVGKAV